MLRIIRLVIPLLFFIFLSCGVFAQNQPPREPTSESFISDINPVYLKKLIDTARKYYPEVKIRSKQVDIARTTLHQNQISWFDIITPSYIYNPQNSLNVVTPSVFNGYQIAITVNIGQLLAKPYQIRNARQSVEVAQYQQQEYSLLLESNIKKLYYNYLRAQAELRLRIRGEQDASANSSLIRLKFQKGEANATLKELNDAVVLQYTQADYKLQAEEAVLIAKTNLEELLGKKLEEIK